MSAITRTQWRYHITHEWVPPKGGALDVITFALKMSNHGRDDHATVWSSVPRMAYECNISVNTAKRLRRAILKLGLYRATGKRAPSGAEELAYAVPPDHPRYDYANSHGKGKRRQWVPRGVGPIPAPLGPLASPDVGGSDFGPTVGPIPAPEEYKKEYKRVGPESAQPSRPEESEPIGERQEERAVGPIPAPPLGPIPAPPLGPIPAPPRDDDNPRGEPADLDGLLATFRARRETGATGRAAPKSTWRQTLGAEPATRPASTPKPADCPCDCPMCQHQNRERNGTHAEHGCFWLNAA